MSRCFWYFWHIHITEQKTKSSIKDFFIKYDQIRRKLRISSHILKKSLMENFIFRAVYMKYLLFIYAIKGSLVFINTFNKYFFT